MRKVAVAVAALAISLEPLAAIEGPQHRFSVPSLERPLPPGSGSPEAGQKVFARKCASCHTPPGQRWPGRIGIAMTACWQQPHALFHFVKTAMPPTAPGTLKDPEVYAVVAFLLKDAGALPAGVVVDAKTLPAVAMPNRGGALPSNCLELVRR